jgi:hypothetical protein
MGWYVAAVFAVLITGWLVWRSRQEPAITDFRMRPRTLTEWADHLFGKGQPPNDPLVGKLHEMIADLIENQNGHEMRITRLENRLDGEGEDEHAER